MSKREIAYLGPIGTYSHLVAEKRFGTCASMIPLPTILDVFAFVSRRPMRLGVIPVENSSGGAIHETVDLLLDNAPPVHVTEEISLDVRLALLGRKEEKVKILFSHFAPLEHCATWLRRRLPKVERRVVASTAAAARMAFVENNAAALGSRKLASIYNLDILHYPVQADIPNVTSFLVISGRAPKLTLPGTNRTTIGAVTHNVPGGLCTFLETFRDHNVNLCRLISRPLRGQPKEYAFFVDIEGGVHMPVVHRAMRAARKACVHLRVIGSYPSGRMFHS